MIVQKLEERKVDLFVLDQGIDTTTMYGRLQLTTCRQLASLNTK